MYPEQIRISRRRVPTLCFNEPELMICICRHCRGISLAREDILGISRFGVCLRDQRQ